MPLTSEQAKAMNQRPRITAAEEQRMVQMWAGGATNSEVYAEFPDHPPGTINNKKTKLRARIADRVRQEAVELVDSPNRRKPARIADNQRKRDRAVWLEDAHIASAFMLNPETGRKEFVESLVDARKLKVYWDAQERANLRIAEELGELPQRMAVQLETHGKATYEIPGLDIGEVVRSWGQGSSESVTVAEVTPEPEPEPVRREVPAEYVGKTARPPKPDDPPREPIFV
jgi:hypothetical protein